MFKKIHSNLFLIFSLVAMNGFAQTPPTAVSDEILVWDSVTGTGDLSDNDLNPSNSTLTYTLLTNTSGGILVVNPNGTYVFTPDPNIGAFNEVLTYQVCDQIGQCDTETISLYIQFHNDVPQPSDDYFYVEMNEPRFGNMTLNDFEPDYLTDPVSGIDSYVVDNMPLHGDVIVLLDGTFQYTPDPGYTGPDSFSIYMCDPCGACAPSSVYLTVVPSNDEPIANNSGTISINEDTAYNGDASSLVTDPENDALTYSAVTGSSHGTVIMNPNGTYTYTPDPNYFGSDSFLYLVCDIVNQCVVATISFNVQDQNDPPVVFNEYFTTNEDIPSFSNTANTNDTNDNGALTYTVFASTSHGTFNAQANGNFTYTPAANYNGQDFAILNVCDATLLCVKDTVFFTITPLNDFPITVLDDTFGYEDAILTGTVANDTDADGDVLTYSFTESATGGTISMTSNGNFTFSPGPNYWGMQEISYQACDPSNACTSGTLAIEIIEINDDPIINSDAVSGNEDSIITGNIRTNDVEPDGEAIFYYAVSSALHGTFTLDAVGTFSYTPQPNWFGTDSIQFYGCDPCSVCKPGALVINVNNVNDTPIIIANNFTTSEDVAISNTVASFVSDIDNSTFTLSIINTTQHGTLTFNSNGSFTYQPNANYFGTDTFTFQACDALNACDSETIQITINSINDTPIAFDDTNSTDEDTMVAGTVSNDTDVDDVTLTYSLISPPLHGTLSMLPNGTYQYTPEQDYFGPDVVTYSVCDDENACDAATLIIDVNSVNDYPVATNDSNVTYENDFLSGSVAANDIDADDDNLSFTITSNASHGSFILQTDGTYTYTPAINYSGADQVTYSVCDDSNLCDTGILDITIYPTNTPPQAANLNISNNEDVVQSGSLLSQVTDGEGGVMAFTIVSNVSNGTLILQANGNYSYQPNANYFGTDSFTYSVCDTGDECDQAVVNITVSSVNDIPDVFDETISLNEEQSTSNTVASNDTDNDGDPLTYSVSTSTTNGVFNLASNGSYTFIPALNFVGIINIVYDVCDFNGGCEQGNLQITVNGVNDAPTAGNDNFTMLEDGALNNNVYSNDNDVDNATLNYSILSAPTHGVVNLSNNGTFSYTPSSNFYGTDSFQYNACDDGLLCANAVVNITINSVNDLPVVNDEFITINEDAIASGNVSVNDSDVDVETLTYAIVQNASNGLLNLSANGTFTYTPTANFFGQETIIYNACDGAGECVEGNLYIAITPENDLPVGGADEIATFEDVVATGDVSTNDTDVDNSVHVYTIVTYPTNGVLVMNEDGQYTYTPNPNYFGLEEFVYEVCDDDNGCTQVTVPIYVISINDFPVVTDEYVNVMEDTFDVGDLSTNDIEPDGQTMTYSIVTTATQGDFTLLANGSYEYYPHLNFSGMDSVTYRVCDAEGACVLGEIIFEVDFMNDAPIAFDEAVELEQDQFISGDLSLNEIEYDNEILHYFVIDDQSHGIFSLQDNGTYTYLPNDGETGTFTVTYYACDPCSVCDEGQITFYVVPIGEQNTAPTALNASQTICQGGQTLFSLNNFVNDVQNSDSELTFTFDTPSTGTMLYDESTHQLAYLPGSSDFEDVIFNYTVCDNGLVPLCSTGSITIDITPTNVPQVENVVITEPLCFGGNNGAIDLINVTGEGNISVQWSEGPNEEDYTALTAGTYSATISSDAACSEITTLEFTVSEPSELNAAVSSSIGISDSGNGSIQIDISGGTSEYTVTWTGPDNYTSSDEDPSELTSAGTYEATITDAHGCTTTAMAIIDGIEESMNEIEIQIAPNPFNDAFNMKVQGMNGKNFSYTIYDASGKLVMDKKVSSFGNGTITIQMKDYPAGLYQLKLTSDQMTKTIGLIHQ